MADYRDDARWKEYGFGRDMFPGGGSAPVASSEYMTAGMWEDYIRPGIEWLGDVIPGIGRSDTSSKETVDEGTKLLRDMMDADEESRKDMDRLLRETEEYDKTFKKISGEYDEYDKTERPGDITKFVKDAVSEAEVRAAWEDWADYGSPTDGSSDIIVTDPDTGVDILYDGATPILDMIGPGTSGTFGSKMSAEVPLEAVPEVDASRDPRWKAFDDEAARLKESGYKWPGPLTPLPWDGKTPRGPEYFEWLHSPRIEAVIKYGSDDDKRAHAKLGHKIPGYTYESATSATATGRVDDPDYERLVREAVPTLDERLDVPDIRTYTPAAGGEVDSSLVDSIISTAAAGGTPGLSEALAAAEREGYEKEGLETSTPLTDLALWTVGGGALGAGLGLGKKLYDSAKLLTGKLPGSAVPSKVYKDAIKATEAGATGVGKKLGAPVGKRKGILGPILGHLSKDVDVLSSLAMGSGKTGKLAYRISDSTKKGVLSKVAKDLHGEATDVTRKRVVDTLRREIGDTHDLSTPEKVTTYLTAMLKSSGGKVGEYARKVDGVDSFADIGVRRAMTGVGKETFGSLPRAVGLGATGGAIGGAYLGGASDIAFGSTGTPYADPYPGMIDPTFEPTATTHYDDILKHFETEAVPSHLPMDITDTPSYAEIMGESYKYDPVMPPPSAYSRPDMELDLATRALVDSDMDMARTTLGDPGYVDPYPGVDDFSGIIPSGIPSYMKKDAGGVWHDTRSFGYMPPGYDWRTGTFPGGEPGIGGSSASMSDDDRLAAALERMASIPAGFIGGPEKTMTYIDATGGPTARFGGVGDIGGGSGTITSPLTGRGGFYAPIGVPPISYTDPGLAPGMGGLGGLWT